MSQNYPSREDWLKVRCTPRKNPPGRFIHVSTRYGWAELPRTGVPGRFIKMLNGVTYRRKREAA
jgi:hypothetical protein